MPVILPAAWGRAYFRAKRRTGPGLLTRYWVGGRWRNGWVAQQLFASWVKQWPEVEHYLGLYRPL